MQVKEKIVNGIHLDYIYMVLLDNEHEVRVYYGCWYVSSLRKWVSLL